MCSFLCILIPVLRSSWFLPFVYLILLGLLACIRALIYLSSWMFYSVPHNRHPGWIIYVCTTRTGPMVTGMPIQWIVHRLFHMRERPIIHIISRLVVRLSFCSLDFLVCWLNPRIALKVRLQLHLYLLKFVLIAVFDWDFEWDLIDLKMKVNHIHADLIQTDEVKVVNYK